MLACMEPGRKHKHAGTAKTPRQGAKDLNPSQGASTAMSCASRDPLKTLVQEPVPICLGLELNALSLA